MIYEIEVQETKSGYYDVWWCHRHLGRFRTPFFSAARVLQKDGVPDEDLIVMRHRGSYDVAMHDTVGRAAARTVKETDRTGPRETKYRLPIQPD
jgi:hypothetical protein